MNMIGTRCKSTRRRNALRSTLEASGSVSRYWAMKAKALSIPGSEASMVFSMGGGEARGFSMSVLIHKHGAQEEVESTSDARSKYNCVCLPHLQLPQTHVIPPHVLRRHSCNVPEGSSHQALRFATSPKSRRVAEVDDVTSDNFGLCRTMAREAAYLPLGCVRQGVNLVHVRSTGCAANAEGCKQAVFFNGHLVRHGDDRRDEYAALI